MMQATMRMTCAAGALLLLGCGHNPALVGGVRGPTGPVAHAEVRLLDTAEQPVRQAQTDGAGKFEVRDRVQPSPYTLEVRADGYQTLRKTIDLPAAGPLDLTLVAQSTLKGTVRMPDQSVVPGAVVIVKRAGQEVRRVTTGSDGVYAIAALDPGDYSMVAADPGGTMLLSYGPLHLTGEPSLLEQDLVLERGHVQTTDKGLEVQPPTVILDINPAVHN